MRSMVILGEIGPHWNKQTKNGTTRRTYFLDLISFHKLNNFVLPRCQIFRKTGTQQNKEKKTSEMFWRNILVWTKNNKLLRSFQAYHNVSLSYIANIKINKQTNNKNAPDTLARLIPGRVTCAQSVCARCNLQPWLFFKCDFNIWLFGLHWTLDCANWRLCWIVQIIGGQN